MPDAYRGFTKTIERLFGINVQYVRAQGLAPELQFNGVYLGGNTLFVNVNSKSPYSTIIGHEFLHYLAKNNPDLYQSFEKIALPLMTERAEKYAMERMAEYKAAGHQQMKSFALGQEEVYADTFGDLWGDESFWRELAGRQGAKGITARVMDQLRSFLGSILKALNLWKAEYQTAGFYDDAQAIRRQALNVTQQAMTDRGQWVAMVDGELRRAMGGNYTVAPVFYSELAGKLAAKGPEKADKGHWLALLSSLPKQGIKPEEIEWSGILDWLALQSGKVAKEVLKKLGGGQMEAVEIDNRAPESDSWYEELTDVDVLKQPGFTITDALRETAMGGLPLFAVPRSSAYDEDHGLPDQPARHRITDGAELTALRRAAAALERPKDGISLCVIPDGQAIATGPKGRRIPDTFRRFAHDRDLAFQSRTPARSSHRA